MDDSSRSESLNKDEDDDDFDASHNYVVPVHIKYPPANLASNNNPIVKGVSIMDSDHLYNRYGDKLSEE